MIRQQDTPGHYQAWRDAVADMMAEPRSSKYDNLFLDDEVWV